MPETDKGKGDAKAKLSNPQIYRRNKDSGKLEVKDGVNDDDIKLLKDEHLLEDNFNLDEGYFSPVFMEKRLGILQEKYKDLTAELPIVYADCDGQALKVSDKAGLTILRGTGTHTKLFVTRPGGAGGKTEIYIMDSNTNGYDKDIEAAYGDTAKYTIVYPDTEVSRQNRKEYEQLKEENKERENRINSESSSLMERYSDLSDAELDRIDELSNELIELSGELEVFPRNSLEIQKDTHHCASYAVHFADRLYKKIREVKDSDSKKNTIDCFNEVMADIGKGTYLAKVESKGDDLMVDRKMFSMPKELWIYSGSEGALDRMITAEAKKQLEEENKKKGGAAKAAMTEKEIEDKVKKIKTDMKRKLAPYKEKRDEARPKRMGEKMKGPNNRGQEAEVVTTAVENELRAEYAAVHNWRMKELKLVANELRNDRAQAANKNTGDKVSTVIGALRDTVSSDSPTPKNPVNSKNALDTPAVLGGSPGSLGEAFKNIVSSDSPTSKNPVNSKNALDTSAPGGSPGSLGEAFKNIVNPGSPIPENSISEISTPTTSLALDGPSISPEEAFKNIVNSESFNSTDSINSINTPNTPAVPDGPPGSSGLTQGGH
ncbi:MAG: hypothetical protein LBU15_00925 [Rickettsiales bacterium]|jgi:hypothetical protein|nr:hypothetical protein [Rickettsiales bacterium]